MSTLTSNGVAPMDESVLHQLQKKHPRRRNPISWPSPEELKVAAGTSSKSCITTTDLEISELRKAALKAIEDSDASLTITAEMIEEAAKRAKRATAGGLQQITPWHLRRAIEASTNHEVAIVAARLATRWGKGDFSSKSGQLAASGRLIGLYKNETRVDVRPVCVGDALRRLLCRAYTATLKGRLKELVGDHQLGVLQGGYEIGVHALRKLANQCITTGEVILILDFSNAFNAANREMMLTLTCLFLPELAKLAFWLYAEESNLVTSRGDNVLSSTGAQQGCHLANMLFALIIKKIAEKIKSVKTKAFYWDDSYLKGTPEEVTEALETIIGLQNETGLRLCLPKCTVHCPTKEAAVRCKTLLPDGVEVRSSMDMYVLKVPIGRDSFVKAELNKKLDDLKKIVNSITEMPHTHEAFSLLQNCANVCRVTHLLRTIPPRQSEDFVTAFDEVLRHGFEKLIGTKLEKKWWRVARLPPKFGGMAMRSGTSSLGAQYAVSVTKCSPEISKMVGEIYKAEKIIARDAKHWLDKTLGKDVDVEALVTELQHRNKDKSFRLSLAQRCELAEQKRVHSLMSADEKLHVEEHKGSDHAWVRTLPLQHCGFVLAPKIWVSAARRRLRVDIAPRPSKCRYCWGGTCDTKGDHAVICGGKGDRNLRHNAIRDLIAKTARDAGFRIMLEHGGDLGDQRRPGDVAIERFESGKTCLIDVAVINPTGESHVKKLREDGAGAAATAYEKIKRAKYEDLDESKFIFVPFILETSGALGKTAKNFISELRQKIDEKICSRAVEKPRQEIDPLLRAISLELQRANGSMILEREPTGETLIMKQLARGAMFAARKREEAIKSLERNLEVAAGTAFGYSGVENALMRLTISPPPDTDPPPDKKPLPDKIKAPNRPNFSKITNSVIRQPHDDNHSSDCDLAQEHPHNSQQVQSKEYLTSNNDASKKENHTKAQPQIKEPDKN